MNYNQFIAAPPVQSYNRKILTKIHSKSTTNMLIPHKEKNEKEKVLPLINKAKFAVNPYKIVEYYNNESCSQRLHKIQKHNDKSSIIKKVHLPKISSKTQRYKKQEHQVIDLNLKLVKNIKLLNFKSQSSSKSIHHSKENITIQLKSHFALTQPGGKHKELTYNQDSYMEKPSGISSSRYQYYGVFDGHGKHGTTIANSVSSFLSQFYSQSQFIGEHQYNLTNILNEITKDHCIKIKSSYSKASDMLKVNNIDASLSGTSATIIFIIDHILICSNAGDSRAIAISYDNQIIPLSNDHKPELPLEKERIIKMNGRVERYCSNCNEDQNGPFRVWLKEENYPGLSMSRSIGDFIAQDIGVIDEPDVLQYSLREIKPKIIVCATDGLWELVSYLDIITILDKYYLENNVEEAVRNLTIKARNTWIKKNNGFIDDITIIVLFF